MEHYDIIIIGGGVAGLCAAIQAARDGARTLLVEKNGMPGGTMTMADVAVPGLFGAWGRQVIAGIGWELVRQTLETEGRSLPDFSQPMTQRHWHYQIDVNPLLFAALAERALLDAKAEILYHTMLARAVPDEGSWQVTLCGKDGLFETTATFVIDCTGDANLTRIAGYAVRTPSVCQPATSSARFLNIRHDAIDNAELAAAYADAKAAGTVKFTDMGWSEQGPRQGSMHLIAREGCNANHINGINAYDSHRRTSLEIEGRQALLRAYHFLKGRKGMEQLDIRLSAVECGVRESRTIVGEYTMTREDYATGRPFDDALCYSFYPIDIHTDDGLECVQLPEGVVPQVPLRIMVPHASHHILAAGRIVSSDRSANSALRIQATCMATGQAAAAIALVALSRSCRPVDAPAEEVRQLLRQHGAIVPH